MPWEKNSVQWQRQKYKMAFHFLLPSAPLQMSLASCNFLSYKVVFFPQDYLYKINFNSNSAIYLNTNPPHLREKKKSGREKHLKQKSAKGDSDKRSEWIQPSFGIRKTSPWNQPINQNLFSFYGVKSAASVNHWLHSFPPSAFLVTFQTNSCVSQTSTCKQQWRAVITHPFCNVCPQDKLSTLTTVVYPQGQSLQTPS